ncbi:toxin-antitoxin system YwqK family antitoxin [Longispora albida]|uniref:toxin-antitoxin system YwqK family antitoxin n=1 Tax=Longispora albida TaxID=203523 RepID=UPI0003711677|nr:hypothetical protein [Longispora albida]
MSDQDISAATVQDGPERTWHINGTMKRERWFRDGLLHGPDCEYDEQGRSISEEYHEYGILVFALHFAEDGSIRKRWELEPGDPEHARLDELRLTRDHVN